MATESRTSDPSLNEPGVTPISSQRLFEHPYNYKFFQMVRLLERLLPDREPVGQTAPPHREIARFSAYPSLAFPASEIRELAPPENGPAKMTVNFMGLTGPIGTMPHWYTLLVSERLQAGDKSIRDFLDIFNHRFISLFYRAWEKYRPGIAYERGEHDPFSEALLNLVGMGTPGLKIPQALSTDAFLYFSGLLAQRPRSALALQLVLEEYFEVPVEIEQFLGSMFALDPATICCPADRETQSEQLGLGAVVGDEIWDPHARIRVKLGPLTAEQYRDFLPGQTAYRALDAWTRFFANDEIEFEVQLILKQDEVPSCTLGAAERDSPLLGWVSWLSSKPLDRNPSDTILQLHQCGGHNGNES
jgi:type VI secretion system protein ImpH